MKNNNNNNNNSNKYNSDICNIIDDSVRDAIIRGEANFIPFNINSFTLRKFESIILKYSNFYHDTESINPEISTLYMLHIIDSDYDYVVSARFNSVYKTISPKNDIYFQKDLKALYNKVKEDCIE
jgi:hypothetical protein